MAQPLAYMMNRSSSNEAATRDLYAQLQAPAQRVAVQDTMQAVTSAAKPTVTKQPAQYVEYFDTATQTIKKREIFPAMTVVTSGSPETYETARTKANKAAYDQTIDPSQLAEYWSRKFGKQVSNVPVQRPYVNPVQEGSYNLSPQFDWKGAAVAGIGASPVIGSKSDALMYELAYGPDIERRDYNDRVTGIIQQGQYEANLSQRSIEQQRIKSGIADQIASQRASQNRVKSSEYSSVLAQGASYLNQINNDRDARNAAFNKANLELANSNLNNQYAMASRQSGYFMPLEASKVDPYRAFKY